MSWIGIDPGLHGAIAHITRTGFKGVWDMPLNRTEDFICAHVLEARLAACDGVICLEAVTPMGSDGRGSLGRFMTVYGGIRALAEAQYKVHLIRPYDWKKALGLVVPAKRGEGVKKTAAERAAHKKAAKEAAMEMARSLYPEAQQYLTRKKDHDRAEAILLAHYLRERSYLW